METPPVLPPPIPPASAPRRSAGSSTTLKIFAVGTLAGLLWLGLLLIDGVRRSRLGFREEAREAIAETWGGEQRLAGPVLAVPVRMPAAGETRRAGPTMHYFLPTDCELDGELMPQELERGIFKVPVYEAKLNWRGGFRLSAANVGPDSPALDWAQARILIPVTQAQATGAAPAAEWNGAAVGFRGSEIETGLGDVLVARVALSPPDGERRDQFSVNVSVRGSRSLAIVLTGERSTARLRSTWADPSFGGATLPLQRTIKPEGFEARWESGAFGRALPQQWTNVNAGIVVNGATMARDSLQVSLLQPVDAYRLVERAIKYGSLFVVLVFAVFFLFEVTGARRIHPVQYLMIGVAVVLFFLGFLALGEFIDAGAAYAIAATASTLLVTGYSASVLGSGTRCAWVGAGLAATYGYLYFVLQLEDYALLGGTAALFALLALAMWGTRKIDWYGRDVALSRAT